MKSTPFTDTIRVTVSHLDDMKHVNNVVYLQWVQDIAKKHWESKTSENTRSTYVWVVLNHYIEYHYPAVYNDELLMETWIENHKGAKSERHTKITLAKTGQLILTAKTTWCLLEKKRLKPVRITEEISNLFS
ncbi:acyl-CoA thioesterase [Aquimarina brevivitae]|uniref:Acyl-CoA thioester hydrolase n=1 Tax=Aquimarina brevivitae TaxID=323412 RepID=A0A4Q7PGX5_9FLAO|nr:thioesterase family protein [Aquimarina brevivitae]RZS99030.1 acyl-CoA thioester hydrolase [Aquimarina brevivitae]